MRTSFGLAAFVVVVAAAAACSSSSSPSDSPAGNPDAGGAEGGGGTGTCAFHGDAVAQNAPGCGGIPDLAGTFTQACQMALDSLKSCTNEYKTLVTCQANGAKCEGGKVVLGACDADTAAFSKCGNPAPPDAGSDSAVTIDPALLAGAWDGKNAKDVAHKLDIGIGSSDGTISGVTTFPPAPSSCGPASVNTATWNGTWTYEAASQTFTTTVTAGTFKRTDCADPALDDTTPITANSNFNSLLGASLSGPVATLTATTFVIQNSNSIVTLKK